MRLKITMKSGAVRIVILDDWKGKDFEHFMIALAAHTEGSSTNYLIVRNKALNIALIEEIEYLGDM